MLLIKCWQKQSKSAKRLTSHVILFGLNLPHNLMLLQNMVVYCYKCVAQHQRFANVTSYQFQPLNYIIAVQLTIVNSAISSLGPNSHLNSG